MSLPDPALPRKLSRWGLYGPFLLALVMILAWSGAWLWTRHQAQARMDAAVEALSRAGYQIGWKERDIGGYPFRIDLTLVDATLREPSGWVLQTPRLEAEAYLHAPGHWIIAAPQGLTFVRPQAGQVMVTGKLIHASLTNLDRRPPSFSFEGLGLAFQSAPGALPFALSAAEKVEFHLRAGPDDEGGLFLTVDSGKARLSGLLARIAGDRPVSLVWNATLSKMSAFRGASWPDAVRRWADAGGRMVVRQAGLTAGEALIGADSAVLTVGDDGRLLGVLPITVRQAPRALGVMGDQGVLPRETAQAAADVAQAREEAGQTAHITLDFQAGRTTLGPVGIGPAPRVYDPR